MPDISQSINSQPFDTNTDIPPFPLTNMQNASGQSTQMSADQTTANKETAKEGSISAATVIKPPSKRKNRKKLVATILALLIVAGGIGAGVFLSQKPQEIREKAFIPPEDVIKVLDCAKFKVYISEEENTQCPQITQCVPNGNQTNNITSYSSTWTITIETKSGFENEKAEIRTITESNYCPDSPCGEFIEGYPVCEEPDPNNPPEGEEFELGNGESKSITVTSESTSGKACGSYQTKLHVGVLNCDPPLPPTETPTPTIEPTPTPTEAPEPTVPPMPEPTQPPRRPRPWIDPCEGSLRRACVDVGPDGFCQTGLTCEEPTPTPTLTPTPTQTPAPTQPVSPTNPPLSSCNGLCTSNSNCSGDLFCYQGSCKNPDCPSDTDCICSISTPAPTQRVTTAPTPIPTIQTTTEEESLPQAGNSTPTIISLGVSLILLIVSIALAI